MQEQTAGFAFKTALLGLSLLLGAAGSSCTRAKAPAAPPRAPAPAWENPPELKINHKALRAGVSYLASDRMKGRYTLSPEIDDAAKWLRQKYRAAKIPSAFGQDYEHRYLLHTGTQERQPPQLSLQRAGHPVQSIKADQIASVAQGVGGRAQGQVVFVGYAIEESGPEAQLKEISALDLRGKVALVLAGAPGDIDREGLEKRAQDLAELYDSKLQAHPDFGIARRKELLISARKAFYRSLCSYIPRDAMPPGYFRPPQRAPASIRAQDLVGPLGSTLHQAQERRGRVKQVSLADKLEGLKSAGAVAAIVIKGPASFFDPGAQSREEMPEFPQSPFVRLGRSPSIPAVWMKSEVASAWLEQEGMSLARLQHAVDLSLRAHSVGIPGLRATIETNLEDTLHHAPNILAVIPGSDLAKEVVIVGGHFDHIGTADTSQDCFEDEGGDTICNGADDNASGTVAILEIARAMRRLPTKPRRTLVFAHFSGEELGLMGSRAIVRDKVIDLSRAVAMINIDMIGRLGARPLKVGGLATSAQWEGLLDGVDHQGIDMLYDASSTERSDHAAFVEQKVPAIFFFSGVHDLYHEPGDELASLDFPSYLKITKVIAELVSTLAQGAPIAWREPKEGQGLVSELPGEEPRNLIKRVPASR